MRYIERVLPVARRDGGRAAVPRRGRRRDQCVPPRPPAVADVKGAARMAELLRRTARQAVPGAPQEFRVLLPRRHPGPLAAASSAGSGAACCPRASATSRCAGWRRRSSTRCGDRCAASGRWSAAATSSPRRCSATTASSMFVRDWWPPLDATEVLGWLRDPEMLARVAEGVLQPEDLERAARDALGRRRLLGRGRAAARRAALPASATSRRRCTRRTTRSPISSTRTCPSSPRSPTASSAGPADHDPHRGRHLRPRARRRGAGPDRRCSGGWSAVAGRPRRGRSSATRRSRRGRAPQEARAARDLALYGDERSVGSGRRPRHAHPPERRTTATARRSTATPRRTPSAPASRPTSPTPCGRPVSSRRSGPCPTSRPGGPRWADCCRRGGTVASWSPIARRTEVARWFDGEPAFGEALAGGDAARLVLLGRRGHQGSGVRRDRGGRACRDRGGVADRARHPLRGADAGHPTAGHGLRLSRLGRWLMGPPGRLGAGVPKCFGRCAGPQRIGADARRQDGRVLSVARRVAEDRPHHERRLVRTASARSSFWRATRRFATGKARSPGAVIIGTPLSDERLLRTSELTSGQVLMLGVNAGQGRRPRRQQRQDCACRHLRERSGGESPRPRARCRPGTSPARKRT